MNLNDFEKTDYSGLYISKDTHPEFGKKYIVRFQYDKKRYVKVLGYTKKDDISLKTAVDLMNSFKDSVLSKIEKEAKKTEVKEKKVTPKTEKDNDIILKLQEENAFFKSILGDYQKLSPQVLNEGIQKIYDLEALKPYQIELIKLQNWLEKENKRMIIIFEGRDASGKGGAIRRITRYMNNKHYRVVALGKP